MDWLSDYWLVRTVDTVIIIISKPPLERGKVGRLLLIRDKRVTLLYP